MTISLNLAMAMSSAKGKPFVPNRISLGIEVNHQPLYSCFSIRAACYPRQANESETRSQLRDYCGRG